MSGNWQRNSGRLRGQYFNFDSISSIARTEGPRGDQETIEQTLELTDEEKSLGLTR
jgi:hypothetical protein